MKGKGHRTFTRASALAVVRRNPGVQIEEIRTREGELVRMECHIVRHDRVGNGTLGVLDYLKKKCNVPTLVEVKGRHGKGQWVRI